jgi:hypothetical protein
MPTQNAWELTDRPAHRKLVALAPERGRAEKREWKKLTGDHTQSECPAQKQRIELD